MSYSLRYELLLTNPDKQIVRDLWQRLVKSRAGYKCEICSFCDTPDKLHAHHINWIGDDNRLNNGICLCPRCHIQVHTLEPGITSIKVFKQIISITTTHNKSDVRKADPDEANGPRVCF